MGSSLTARVTCTRVGAEVISRIATRALFGRRARLATLPGDVEVNPRNWKNGEFRTDRKPIPSEVPIYKGMRLYLTRNVRKEDDYGFITGVGIEMAYGVGKMFKKHPMTGTALKQWGVATGFYSAAIDA